MALGSTRTRAPREPPRLVPSIGPPRRCGRHMAQRHTSSAQRKASTSNGGSASPAIPTRTSATSSGPVRARRSNERTSSITVPFFGKRRASSTTGWTSARSSACGRPKVKLDVSRWIRASCQTAGVGAHDTSSGQPRADTGPEGCCSFTLLRRQDLARRRQERTQVHPHGAERYRQDVLRLDHPWRLHPADLRRGSRASPRTTALRTSRMSAGGTSSPVRSTSSARRWMGSWR